MDGWKGVIGNDLIKIIGATAPLIASALGSPGAGLVISVIEKALGIPSLSDDSLRDALKNDSTIPLKLKALEYEHREALERLVQELDNADRANARNREIELKGYVPTILAIGFLINYALIQVYCVTHTGSEIDIISARFQDVLIMIMSYYFGASHKGNTP